MPLVTLSNLTDSIVVVGQGLSIPRGGVVERVMTDERFHKLQYRIQALSDAGSITFDVAQDPALDPELASATVEDATVGGTPSIGTAELVDLAVTTAKLDDLAVTTGKIGTGAVTGVKVGSAVLTAVHPALAASPGGAIPLVYQATIADGNTVSIFTANAPRALLVMDAWSVNKSADGGTWVVDNGATAITDVVTTAASDKDIDRASTINDAVSTIALNGSLRVVGDGVTLDAIVFVQVLPV